jgi:hypothetical protein
MNNSKLNLGLSVTILLSACLLTGCGGTKVLKEPKPIMTTQPLAANSDERVTATLDWVIVRGGPGTWAKNADWDQYLLRVSNLSGQAVRVTQLTVVDSLDARNEAQTARKPLVKGSKKTARRYKDSGIEVRAGRGAGTMLAAGAAVTLAGVGAAAGAAYGAAWGTAAGGAGAAASGLLLLGPALVVGGIVRGINNGRVGEQIEIRQTLLPLDIPANKELGLNVFFPLSPSPKMVELVYTDATGTHGIVIDTSTVLDGLHLEASAD